MLVAVPASPSEQCIHRFCGKLLDKPIRIYGVTHLARPTGFAGFCEASTLWGVARVLVYEGELDGLWHWDWDGAA